MQKLKRGKEVKQLTVRSPLRMQGYALDRSVIEEEEEEEEEE
jgi:hypothetical protein